MPSPTDIRPPFTEDTAHAKVQAAEDAWNTRDRERLALAHTEDSEWRNRTSSSVAMSRAMSRGSGGAATATRCGSSSPTGSCARRYVSINDVPIAAERRIATVI